MTNSHRSGDETVVGQRMLSGMPRNPATASQLPFQNLVRTAIDHPEVAVSRLPIECWLHDACPVPATAADHPLPNKPPDKANISPRPASTSVIPNPTRK